MSKNTAETLRILFAMDPKQIDRDLKAAAQDIPALASKLHSLASVPPGEKTAETNAEMHHLMMIHARVMSDIEEVPSELKAFYAESATWISDEAVMIDVANGWLRKLLSPKIAEDDWHKCEMADAEFEAAAERVGNTVFDWILRRYGLDDQADLHERDPRTFDMRHEIGRRATSNETNSEAEKLLDKYCKKKFGEDGFRQIVERAAELRRRAH